jgi:hypothetical protein
VSKQKNWAVEACGIGGGVFGFVTMMILSFTTEVVPGGAVGGAIGGGGGAAIGYLIGNLLFAKK